jgi:hypothetical protein
MTGSEEILQSFFTRTIGKINENPEVLYGVGV